MTSIKRRFFKNIEDAVSTMIANEWKLAAGSTSNCQSHYDVAGIGETVDGKIISILTGVHLGHVSVSPCEMVLTSKGPLALGNYGIPEVDSTIESALLAFNNSYSERKCNYNICRYRPICKVVWKDGTTWEAKEA